MKHCHSLAKSGSLVLVMLFLIGCNTLFAMSTATSVPAPTNPPAPTFASTPAAPAYSEVIKTYPTNAALCKTVVDITDVGSDGNPTSFEGTFYGFDFKCYGIQLTAKVPVTINGVSYPIGTMITVDAEQNYIVVSSWD